MIAKLQDKWSRLDASRRLIVSAAIGLFVLHIAGALKHHLFDKDRTLLRMLGR